MNQEDAGHRLRESVGSSQLCRRCSGAQLSLQTGLGRKRVEGEPLKERCKLAGKKQSAGGGRNGARRIWELSVWVEEGGGSRANLACRQQKGCCLQP